MDYLCRKAGLRIEGIHYNLKALQFISSMLYQRGIPYVEQGEDAIKNAFSEKEVGDFLRLTAKLNQKGYGDHAVFVVVKSINATAQFTIAKILPQYYTKY